MREKVHPSLCALVTLYAQRGLACSPDSIDNLISLIWPNLAEIKAFAYKHIAWMHASLHAWVNFCAQRCLACSPDSIDTLISLIWPNLAKIWACACKKIVRSCWIKCLDKSAMFYWFNGYFDIYHLTQFGLARQKILCINAGMCAFLRACAQTSESWPTCPQILQSPIFLQKT